jgi:hypothetical protein
MYQSVVIDRTVMERVHHRGLASLDRLVRLDLAFAKESSQPTDVHPAMHHGVVSDRSSGYFAPELAAVTHQKTGINIDM